MSKSIPQLTAKTSATTGDLFHLVRSNVDYKILYEDLVADINSRYGNTIFVNSVSGNNSTGEVENPAKPFQTLAAARTAGVAYYTGGTAPSSTNIITMDVRGRFSENISLVNFYSYNLNDSVITGTIIDIVGGVNCIIYGNGVISSSGTVVSLSYASALTINAYSVSGTYILSDTLATCYTDARYVTATNSNICNSGAGSLTFINADMSNTGAPLIQGAIIGTVIMIECSLVSAQEIYKSPTGSNTSIITFRRCRLRTTGTNYDAINLLTNTGTNTTLTINDCTLIANGSGNSIDAAQATNVYCYGRNQVNLTHDTGNVTFLVGTVANYGFVIDAATA